jgi:hypothetical protein
MKLQGFLATLCVQKAVLLRRQKFLSPKILMPEVTAFFQFPGEKSGLEPQIVRFLKGKLVSEHSDRAPPYSPEAFEGKS